MKFLNKNIILSALAMVAAIACSNPSVPETPRTFGTEFSPSARVNFNSHETNIGACDRMDQLQRDTNGADLFSYFDSFSFQYDHLGPRNFQAGSKLNESPLLMNVLASDRVKLLVESDKESFKDYAKISLKIGECRAEDMASWGLGCKSTWAQSAGAMGCKPEELATNAICQTIWAQVNAKLEIGKCAYVESSPIHDGDIECARAKQQWDQILALDGQDKLFLAKNDFLNQKFPGIFGGTSDASQSLLLSLVAKQKDFFTAGPANVSAKLTAKLPLFEPARTWTSWRQDMETSNSAWINGAPADAPALERICSLVLAHRAFAQLLSINGFLKPEMQAGSAIPLAVDRNSLGAVPNIGVYLTPMAAGASSFQPTIMKPADLASYNPGQSLVLAASTLPNYTAAPTLSAEQLTDRLERLLGLENFFEATSPVATWMGATQPYILGDIEDRQNNAILPLDAHALAFGLIGLDFRNLAALNIVPIKADGAMVASPQDVPAGFALLKNPAVDFKGIMALDDLLKFARIVVRLDAALEKILKSDPQEIARKNPFYSAAVRQGAEQLLSSVRQFKLPLIFLTSRLAEAPLGSRKICVAAVEMNLAPVLDPSIPRQKPKGFCSTQTQQEYRAVRPLLEASVLQENK